LLLPNVRNLRGRDRLNYLIYNYLCNQWLSQLKLWVRISLMNWCTRFNIMW